MIDMCVDGARVVVERWRQFLMSPVGVYLYSVVTGALGIVILLVFFSMVLSPGAVLILLPCIIAFNSASSGYGLVDKCRIFPKKRAGLVTIAAILAAVGCVTVAILYPWEPKVDGARFLLGAGAALIGTLFGAWVAGKKYKINEKIDS